MLNSPFSSSSSSFPKVVDTLQNVMLNSRIMIMDKFLKVVDTLQNVMLNSSATRLIEIVAVVDTLQNVMLNSRMHIFGCLIMFYHAVMSFKFVFK